MRSMRVRPPATAPIRMPSARDIPPPANDNHRAAGEAGMGLLAGRALLIVGILASLALIAGSVGWLGWIAWKALF